MTNELHKYFDAERRAVGRARAFVITSLEAWGITGEPAEDIRFCVSELASNALTHGTRRGHGFLVRLRAAENSVRLEVHDSRDISPDRQPRMRETADTDTAGRGLSIVDTLAEDWGVDERSPYGKVVWSRFKAVPTPQPGCPLAIEDRGRSGHGVEVRPVRSLGPGERDPAKGAGQTSDH